VKVQAVKMSDVSAGCAVSVEAGSDTAQVAVEPRLPNRQAHSRNRQAVMAQRKAAAFVGEVPIMEPSKYVTVMFHVDGECEGGIDMYTRQVRMSVLARPNQSTMLLCFCSYQLQCLSQSSKAYQRV
jgi:hypothetical protein